MSSLFLLIASLQESAPPLQEGAADGGGPFSGLLIPMALIMVVFYVVMIGPERKQRKKREQMLAAVGKGDKVMTSSGMYASVAAVQDDVITLQIADGVRVRFARSSIQTLVDDEQAESKKGESKKS